MLAIVSAPVAENCWASALLCRGTFLFQHSRCIGDTSSSVLQALAPNYGIDYFLRNHKQGWVSLGGVVLAITGTEAFFADLVRILYLGSHDGTATVRI